MLAGHYGVAFALKPAEPRISLGVLFVAVQFVDMLWTVLVLAGVEKVRIAPGITAATPLDFISFPWSHSLLMTAVWTLAAFVLVRLLPVYKGPGHTRAALIVALAVLSHWLLDLPMHRPDLPIGLHGPYVGLGLWYSRAATDAAEAAALLVGFWIYRRNAKRPNYGLLVLVLFLLIVVIVNTFGPPPPNVAAVASSGLAFYVFVAAVAWWLDRPQNPAAVP
jgi:hypothetical protein